MRVEYLLFTLIVFVVALAGSFEPRTRFIDKWKYFLPAIGLYLVPLALWIMVASSRHWFYNALYTLPFRLVKVPVEELLYGIILPFFCLTAREIQRLYFPNNINRDLEWVRVGLFALIPIGLVIFRANFEYAGLVCVALGVVAFADRQIGTNIFLQTRTYWYIAMIVPCAFCFELYLSLRPVIIYEKSYLVNLRLVSVPLETIFFRLSQVLCCTVFYEWRLQNSSDRSNLI